ncbi:E3 ubiquitin- ligase PDZRN3-like [Paramuricea clavata]|uniref:E3 ubiquitin- ligase PDZRN3-like n=1 Tax=Paramuricea clavata TaxID=317549 RepID=A0A6S7G9D5_PARCT|nr:E3 ubiquitin- ligase PDZRN3-like [Paramuricea clavata]
MAFCPTEEKMYGYEDSRFEKVVDVNFHCSICRNVLKEPRTCRNNEHIFCLGCISEHLRVNSQTCPECKEDLSVDTLRRARLASNCLSKLKINCDHASRGCVELTCLEDLETHVANCGYAPVLCSNAECGMVINKRERVHHETEICQYRKMKCHDCRQIQEDVGTLKGSLMELDGKVEAANKEMKKSVGELTGSLSELDGKVEAANKEMKKTVGELKGSLSELDGKVEVANKEMKKTSAKLDGSLRELDGKVEAANKEMKKTVGELKGSLSELDGKVEATNKEMKKTVGKLDGSLKELDGKVEAVKNSQDQMKQEQQKVKKEVEDIKKGVKDVKETVSKVNKDVDKVKVITSQVLEKLNMLELLNKLPSLTEGMFKTPREDILIAGGRALSNNSTEIYSWEKNGWFEVSMNKGHSGASSFIYNDQLFVVGGAGTKTIETLDLNELLLKWMKYPGKLPYRGDDHQTVAYQQRIIHIGGYNYDQRRLSDMISELQLTSPVTMKKLCQMPDPRSRHGAETFEDKVMILGGEDHNSRPLNSVLEFDVKKSECKEMPPLPHPVTRMATVRWRDQVVVLGGRDENRQALNDVFMYDCKTGKTTALPSMLEKRVKCCAVITGNTIVVVGGENEKNGDLSSVECFTMGGSTWEYLPAMNKARYGAVAEVLPPTKRKYVLV